VNLPPGLSLNEGTGLISGTPSLAGSYVAVLRAINAGGTGSQNWSLQVNLPPPPAITSAAAVTGSVDDAFYYQIQASNLPTGFQALGLPPGLALNAASGLISGVPTLEGAYQVALTASNAGGASAVFGLTISIGPAGSVPEGMVLVEGGTLVTSNELNGTAVATFFIGRYEVTWGEWQEVRTWAVANGYDIGSRGDGCAAEHPVHSVAWFDVLKWCNAKSEMEGLPPVYTVSGNVYRTGEPDHTSISQNLSANGYRLPQEAEWEFAARGGNQTSGYTYSGSNDLNEVGWYLDNASGAACSMYSDRGTWPVGQKAPNELGLYDMSGNVWEWCWDRWSDTSSDRLFRGGSWDYYAYGCTVSDRDARNPAYRVSISGFRLARSSGPVPTGFAMIPAGSFEMGDHFSEGDSNERPVHTVYVSAFYMGRTEVTKAQWDAIRAWAAENGYTDLPAGGGKGPDHPVYSVSWYDAVKWLNAWSEKDGLNPVYRVSGAVMRSGQSTPEINYAVNGYRLPTEAEWEKAARGGLTGRRFPWGDEINHDYANYRAYGSRYTYDTSPYTALTHHPAYNDGTMPYTSPVGSFAPNGYGLYDMVGNVWEWCNDWWSTTYYGSSPAADPTGPASGTYRVIHGGSWGVDARECRMVHRNYFGPDFRYSDYGFRPARTPSP
jgi:formylglycine-generating enzyme required for sulfatase activity